MRGLPARWTIVAAMPSRNQVLLQLWTFAAGLGTAAALVAVVAFGNGAKFIFDIGLGSAERIAAMKIPYC